jgi:hypothetical protein
MLEDIPGWAENSGPLDAWHRVPAHNISYASLVGIPVSGLVSDTEAGEFNIETSYWRLDCPIVQRGDMCELLKSDSFQMNDPSPPFNISGSWGFLPLNDSRDSFCPSTGWLGQRAMSSALFTNSSIDDSDGRGCAANQTDALPRRFIYSGWPQYFASSESDSDQFSALCTITTSWVEVEVRCQGRECAVPRMRRSQLSHPSPDWTALEDIDCANFGYFSFRFLNVADASTSAEGALPQGYLAYPNDPGLAVHGVIPAPNPADIGSVLFAQRLGQLLNTWWLVSVGREVISSGVDMGKVGRVGKDLSAGQTQLQLNTTSGTLTHQVVIIKCSMGWFVALVVVSAVLIVASAVPLVLRLWTRTPAFNILPSTMLKDNPYFEAPKTGSTLESSERSRLLRHRTVRFGDVAPDDAVGYLAVGSLGDGNDSIGEVRRVQKSRLYR